MTWGLLSPEGKSRLETEGRELGGKAWTRIYSAHVLK